MSRQMLSVIGAIVFFFVIYLIISHSFFVETVDASKKHMIKQTRISLREVSDRMATFLNEQSEALNMLGRLHELREGISNDGIRFIEEISLMELTNSEVFLALDEKGDCITVAPEKYTNLFLKKNFSDVRSFRTAKEDKTSFITPAMPVKDTSLNLDTFFIFASTPIYNRDNSFGGVVVLGFRVEKVFEDYLKPLETNYDGSMVCVTDLDGNIEVSSKNNLIKKNSSEVKPTVLPPIPKELRTQGYHGHYEWETSEGAYLVIYHPITVDKHTWLAQFKIPYTTINQFLYPFYWKLSGLLLILVLVALTGIFITITAGKQILQLKKQISALEIQIDHERKKAAVEEITSSEYFQILQQEADKLKKY